MARTVVYRSRRHNWLSVACFVILLVVSLAGLALWRMQSLQVMSVESGSMAPAIRKGDAVAVRPVSLEGLKVGDVVSYRSPVNQAMIVTHRVVQVEPVWQQVITKGDAVTRDDQPVPASNIIGRVDVRVMYAGYALDFFRTPYGLAALVYVPAAVIIISELRRLARSYSRPTYRLAGYPKLR